MARKLYPIARLLQQKVALQPLYGEIQRQQQLLRQVRAALPPKLAPHCSGARLNGAQLLLFVDAPVWASKLRFLSPKLLQALRAENPGIANIKVRMDVPQRTSAVTPQPRRKGAARHSNQASGTVHGSADTVGNSALSQALRRLARTLRED